MSDAFTVECLIRRPGGTEIELPGPAKGTPSIAYHFRPSSTDERHLAVVSDPHHLALLRRVPEAYAVHEATAPASPGRGLSGGEGVAGAPLPVATPDPAIGKVDTTPVWVLLIDRRGLQVPQFLYDKALPFEALPPEAQALLPAEPTALDLGADPVLPPTAEQIETAEAVAAELGVDPQDVVVGDDTITIQADAATAARITQDAEREALMALTREDLAARFEAKAGRPPKATATKAMIVDRLLTL